MVKKCFLFLILFLSIGNLFPQDIETNGIKQETQYDTTENLSPLKFDQTKISKYKSQKEFDYIDRAKSESWWTRFKRWINKKYNDLLKWLFGSYEPGSLLSLFISALPYILLLLLLGIIVWLFTRLNHGGMALSKPKTSEVLLSKEEELVKHEDLPALIAQAVRDKNYRLAVRYYYLNELRKLDELQLITYEYQKTNKDYAEELKNKGLRKHFYETTRMYEFIWYGGFGVSETAYRHIEKGFLEMEQVLNSAVHE